MIALVAAALLSGAPALEPLGPLTFAPAAGWAVKRRDREGVGSCEVVAPDGLVRCELGVVLGAGQKGESEVDTYLADARKDYVGTSEKRVSLKTPLVAFRGSSLVGSKQLEPFGKQGVPTTEIYAARVGSDLVVAQFTLWAANPKSASLRESCLAMIRSLAPAKAK